MKCRTMTAGGSDADGAEFSVPFLEEVGSGCVDRRDPREGRCVEPDDMLELLE